MKFPRDLDIFSPETFKKPVCIQYWTSGDLPETASICAISASWWGNIKSSPPPCMSYWAPKYFSVIAVSSICHPGLPLPQGESQTGSPANSSPSRFFHKAKSLELLLESSTSILWVSSSSILRLESFPNSSNLETSKYTPVSVT